MRVSEPPSRAKRRAVGDDHCEDHLPQIGPVVLAVAVAAERLATGAFEIQAGGVHEHQVEPREQIAPMCEQPFLDQILDAAGRKRRAAVLILRRQFLPEPCHRAIEVMQVEPIDPDDPIIFAPAIRAGLLGDVAGQHG